MTAGCGSDLKVASNMAYEAVRTYGMFADEGASYITSGKEDVS